LKGPILDIRPLSSGLFKITDIIRNTGSAEATNVAGNITLEGGAFIGAETSGVIAGIPQGAEAEISSGLIIGLGATSITVTADIRPHSGMIMLFYI
jgi:hypothetical protein